MIKKIYKYMHLRTEFFKQPMLRATPIRLLNDPFEANIQHYQIADVVKHLVDNGNFYPPLIDDDDNNVDIATYDNNPSSRMNWFNKNKKYLADSEQKRLMEDFESFGVVSFTEDYGNLLMWAHYADEHRGMVIEFSNQVTWLNEIKSDKPNPLCCFGFSPFSYIQEKPERVVYRSERPKFEFASDVIDDIGESKIYDNYFFSKGDNWMYEKEHRSVLPLKFADKIIATHTSDIEECADIYPTTMKVDFQPNNKFITNDNFCEITYSSFSDEDVRSTVARMLSYKDKNPLFLYSVNARVILGVYLGCRVSDSQAIEVLDAIRSNHAFDSNIRVKRAKLSSDRYSLEFEDISYPMLVRI